jgi:hypothetical protein
MENKTITIIMLVASALILLLEISIFISVLPQRIQALDEYKREVNSTLSDKELVENIIAQNLAQRTRIDELEVELAEKGMLLERIEKQFNTSISVETSPFNRIGKDDVKVYSDRVVIYVNKAFTAGFTESKSMYPFINEDVYALEIRPNNRSELKVGDVIGFESKAFNTTIIHRIIEIGSDEQGWYALTKGDNNPATDPGKVRFEDIRGVLVGLIY